MMLNLHGVNAVVNRITKVFGFRGKYGCIPVIEHWRQHERIYDTLSILHQADQVWNGETRPLSMGR